MIDASSYGNVFRTPRDQSMCRTILRAIGASLGVGIFITSFVLMTILPNEAQAYVDPGTAGTLSQVLYVVFYVALGFFFYYLRSIKQYVSHTKDFLKRLIGSVRSSKD